MACFTKFAKFAKFQKFQLDNLVDFEKCGKTRIYLQRSAPIQPKTSEILPKIKNPSTRRRAGRCRTSPSARPAMPRWHGCFGLFFSPRRFERPIRKRPNTVRCYGCFGLGTPYTVKSVDSSIWPLPSPYPSKLRILKNSV